MSGTERKPRWEAWGPVCGPCGHEHRSEEAAQRCADAHHRAIRSVYRSAYPTRAYSDRSPREVAS